MLVNDRHTLFGLIKVVACAVVSSEKMMLSDLIRARRLGCMHVGRMKARVKPLVFINFLRPRVK